MRHEAADQKRAARRGGVDRRPQQFGQRGSPWTSARLGGTASIQLAWWRGRSAAGSPVAPNRRNPSGGSGAVMTTAARLS